MNENLAIEPMSETAKTMENEKNKEKTNQNFGFHELNNKSNQVPKKL